MSGRHKKVPRDLAVSRQTLPRCLAGKRYKDFWQLAQNVTMLSLSTSISIIFIDNMALVYFLTVGILQQKPITWIY